MGMTKIEKQENKKMIDNLIKPITKNAPTGKDLRNDISSNSIYYQAKDARNTARQIERKIQIGTNDDTPNWDIVIELSVEILIKHSKDLEVTVWLIEAWVRKSGFAGLKSGFDLLYQLINKYWDNIYPFPDEDGIKTRIMPLIWLNGEDTEGILIQPLRNIAITEGTSIGPFTLWQYQQALANENITDSKTKNKKLEHGEIFLEHIQKAVQESSPEFYAQLCADLKAATESFTKLNKLLDKKCGKLAPPISRITQELEIFKTHLNYITQDIPSHAPRKGEADGAKPAVAGDFQKSAASFENLSAGVQSSEKPSVVGVSPQKAVDGDDRGHKMAVASVEGVSGTGMAETHTETSDTLADNEIKIETSATKTKSHNTLSDRAQALQQLEQIANFFKEIEPHSPIPYMLARAAKWGNMPFPELLKEIIHDENYRKNIFELTGLS